MTWLIVGLAMFLGVHLIKALGLRGAFAGALGEGAYKLAYTAVAVIGLGLIIYGKIQAHPSEIIWSPPIWSRHLALTLVPIAFVLLVSAYAPGHIRRLARHPMTAAVILWSAAHLMANGELSALILFGGFFVWSVIAYVAAWIREPAPAAVEGWGGDLTAIVLGALAAALILRFHVNLFGVGVLN